MSVVQKIINFLLFISLAGFIVLQFIKQPLPSANTISQRIVNTDPIQVNIADGKPYDWNVKDQTYKITPVADYDITGLVVEEYDSTNFFDITHKSDPAQTKDLCLIWGINITTGAYKEVSYSHGEFTCYVRWNRDVGFNGSQLSNNHLIPATTAITERIRNAHIGDQVRIKGQLVNYEIYNSHGEKISYRNTSIGRDDQGCEIIMVNDFQTIGQPAFLLAWVRTGCLIAFVSAAILEIILVFIKYQ